MTPEEIQPQQQSDDAALDAQVRAFLESRVLIQAHIRTLVREAALAEDVFQEVWVRFERITRHGELVQNVPAWCRATARLVALENWRKLKREQPMQDEDLHALVDQAYAEQDEEAEFWSGHQDALQHCLDALPPRSREMLVRRYRHEQPLAGIAAALGQSLASIKTSLCRLRLALADCVRKRLQPHPAP